MPAAPDPAAEDFYARLGADRAAPPDAVRAAYREAVRRHPPERDAEAFKRVREAFETLGDETRRAEYDLLHDDGTPAGLLARAERAMADRDWEAAEPLLKRVLVEDPGAGRPRNMLALCYLHRELPGPAAAQYDRLLARPDPDTVWLTNAAHAYRQSGRLADARAAAERAAARPDADQAECAVTLADVHMAQDDPRGALAVLTAATHRVPGDTPGAVALLLRELDVHVAQGNTAGYRAAVARAEAAAERAGWQQQGAYRLGVVAWRLIDGEAFGLALVAAEAARRLQPDDVDYDAQVQVAEALHEHQLTRARQLVRTHVAFAPGRWLPRLGARVLEYCDRHAAFDGMRRVGRPPGLLTLNSVGTRLAGRSDEDPATRSYVSTLYFCVLFVPLLPVARYRVRDAEEKRRGWVFLGRLPLTRGQRARLWGGGVALLTLLGVCSVRDSRQRAAAGLDGGLVGGTPRAAVTERGGRVELGPGEVAPGRYGAAGDSAGLRTRTAPGSTAAPRPAAR